MSETHTTIHDMISNKGKIITKLNFFASTNGYGTNT